MLTVNQNLVDEFVFYLKDVKFRNKIQNLKLEYQYPITKCDGWLYLALIIIKKSKRNQGIGSEIIKEIIKFADTYNLEIKLWPSDKHGSDYNRLIKFYENLGFFLIDKFEKEYMSYKKII
jgi:GNAT superfamily N-acetyltransferase